MRALLVACLVLIGVVAVKIPPRPESAQDTGTNVGVVDNLPDPSRARIGYLYIWTHAFERYSCDQSGKRGHAMAICMTSDGKAWHSLGGPVCPAEGPRYCPEFFPLRSRK